MNTYWSEYDGHINWLHLKKHPSLSGLGVYEDSDGNKWDVGAIIGNYVCAMPYVSGFGRWSTAGNFSGWATRHIPFYVYVSDESLQENLSKVFNWKLMKTFFEKAREAGQVNCCPPTDRPLHETSGNGTATGTSY